MDQQYAAHCVPDTCFYERPDRHAAPLFAAARRPVPAGWRAARHGDWLALAPRGGPPLPSQGWKIHVSATTGGAEAAIGDVWEYCVPRGIPFKFVAAPRLWRLRNAKYAPRDGSGKLVTVYPADEAACRAVLDGLHARLGGRPGPYVLTDLRWAEGPLYVRYGAFAPRWCADERGRPVPAVADGRGRLVPDRRDPVFHVPEWVTLPAFLAPQLAARNAVTLDRLPYRVESVLHYSNGGGVYRATDTRDGRTVVLKEARPHAGLTADGADAVARLEREMTALEKAAGLGVAPAVHDWCVVGEHRFLVMEHIEGATLHSRFARRHPLMGADPDPAEVAAYTRWALRVHRAVERAVTALHGRDLCFNDLHPSNILLSPDEESITLVDFEAAAPASLSGRQIAAHPGFLAPSDRTGTDIDRYALAVLRLALFLPLSPLFALDRGMARPLAEAVADRFPEVPRGFLGEAVAEITRPGPVRRPAPSPGAHTARWSAGLPAPDDWPRGRDAMVRAVLASATPEREDRLFPGDIAQFTPGGGLGLAHGAAGVLYALAEAGAPRYEEGEWWLLAKAGRLPPGTPLGLYDGVAGLAYVLERLGHRQMALDLAGTLLYADWRRLPPDLHGGLAGVGLVLDHLAEVAGEPRLHERAVEAARLAAGRLRAAGGPRVAGGPRPPAGLLHGATGPALLFLRLYERDGNPGLLELAGDALRRDVARCVPMTAGAVGVDEGWRTVPFLGTGGVGVGAVLDDYLAHAPGSAPEFAGVRAGIVRAARSRFDTQPGLFQGRAGFLWHLHRTSAPGVPDGELDHQLTALARLRLAYGGGVAFPGQQMLRLSMDLATGTAGCLLALASVLSTRPAAVPFLPPRGNPRDPAPRPAEP
ncbi:class III lanthionine synthetase LanKC [Streptomyces sp. XM4011]|uniref:class III lanthionine synthetase LanKC n=1 Tax=Streptomyces sp. XM4011 TaxID=2929780 RepID=UPI001FF88AB9|nr:class III lanthionine synthetase LanKC [Streptomyces sp. XM4011]MCK1816780.1 class III lanthionine synthetase LanKC [Streptomyces sp. XM4011]